MKVLVDSSIWSLALRRRREDLNPEERKLVNECWNLIGEGNAVLIGAARQETLSGIRENATFERVREIMSSFADEPTVPDDYEQAARLYNTCRAEGVAGSHIDFLICAVAVRCGFEIFTSDDDFDLYSKHLPVALHAPRGGRA